MSLTLTHPRFLDLPDLTAVAAGDAILQTGSKGEGVKAIQGALEDLAFTIGTYKMGGRTRGGADGIFGSQTRAALRNFQVHAQSTFPGMAADGVLGMTSLKALDQLATDAGMTAWDSRANTLRPGSVWEGETPCRIVVVLGEHRTFLFDTSGQLSRIFLNASGAKSTRTDPGLKRIDGILNEAQSKELGRRLWSSPSAFGSRILNLSWHDGAHSGEELHGTGRPDQLGMNVSHGCVRHYNEDIITLSEAISVGDRVAIVNRIDDPRLHPASDAALS